MFMVGEIGLSRFFEVSAHPLPEPGVSPHSCREPAARSPANPRWRRCARRSRGCGPV